MAALYLELLWELSVVSHSHSHRSRLYTWYFRPRANRKPVPIPSAQKCRFTPLLGWKTRRVRVRLLRCGALPESSWLCSFTRAADQEEKKTLFWGQCLHREQITAGDKLSNRDIAILGQKRNVKVRLCLHVCKYKYSSRIHEASDNNCCRNRSWVIDYDYECKYNKRIHKNYDTYWEFIKNKTHSFSYQRHHYCFILKSNTLAHTLIESFILKNISAQNTVAGTFIKTSKFFQIPKWL